MFNERTDYAGKRSNLKDWIRFHTWAVLLFLMTNHCLAGRPDFQQEIQPNNASIVVSSAAARSELQVKESDREHWAFRPLALKDSTWTNGNLIDAFFEKHGPSAEATRHKLIRRLYFDLLGLPPTPAQVESFVSDDTPNAFEELVDRLLSSKHYGERWGRHWLDVARYADSDGYESDLDRPQAWPYRDWVIRAFNNDLPFDTFVKWQIAGDEYEPSNPDAVIATGFLAAGPSRTTTPADTEENKLKIRYDELDDMVSTTGAAFLGLTVGCARCHDHKFDPIPTRDYYRMVAAYSTTERRVASLSKPRRELKKWIEVQRAVWREDKMEAMKLTDDEKFWMRQPEHFFVPIQKDLYKKYGEQLTVAEDQLHKWLPNNQRSIWDKLSDVADEAETRNHPSEKALVMLDRQAEPVQAFLLERGSVSSRFEEVAFGFLQIMTRDKSPEDYRSNAIPAAEGEIVHQNGFVRPKTTYQRKALSEWLTDVEHGAGPLLARVTMNRIWQHHFGEGFTPTPNDVGSQSLEPQYPELLEQLAREFVQGGWKMKPIHKQIVMSAVYRAPVEDTLSNDSQLNSPPRKSVRLQAEALRDAMLAVSGRLNRKMFGPPFRPIIPKEAIATRSKDKYPTDIQDSPAIWRRSVYAFKKRSVQNPMMEVFDAPDPGSSCGRRNTTTIPTQALTLMNNPLVRDCAVQFAQRVINEVGLDSDRQIARVYELALSRPPTELEHKRAQQFLSAASDANNDAIPVEGLTDLCHVLFTLNEFVYVD